MDENQDEFIPLYNSNSDYKQRFYLFCKIESFDSQSMDFEILALIC